MGHSWEFLLREVVNIPHTFYHDPSNEPLQLGEGRRVPAISTLSHVKISVMNGGGFRPLDSLVSYAPDYVEA